MTTSISDLPEDLLGEVLSRVPLTSLSATRSTCQKWNALSKNQVLSAKVARKQFLGFIIKNLRVCSLKFDFRGFENNNADFVDPSITEISIFHDLEISKAFHCDGLLLCIPKNVKSIGLLVWNPYLGQMKTIKPRKSFELFDRYAIGYDKNRTHKILRIFGDHQNVFGYEINNLTSNSWKCVHIKPDWYIWSHQHGVSVKGNTYFAAKRKIEEIDGRKVEDILLCFDYATETFGGSLPLPLSSDDTEDNITLSCVKDEQLAVLHKHSYTIEIWVMKKIHDLNVVSWIKFTRVPATSPVESGGSFFMDEDYQVAVVFDRSDTKWVRNSAFIIGPIKTLRSVNIGESLNIEKVVVCCVPPKWSGLESCVLEYYRQNFRIPLVCSYVPSLVELRY